jgi:phage terminase small subunit
MLARERAMLAATHLLTVADLKALEAYCIMYANFRKMASDLTKANMLVYKPRPRDSPAASIWSKLPQSSMLRALR